MRIFQHGPARLLALAALIAAGTADANTTLGAAKPGDVTSASDRLLYAQAPARTVRPANPKPDLDALIKAAQLEGEVTFYVAATGFGERIVEGFVPKYGIKTQFVRMPSAQVLQRYAAEAETGNVAADLVSNSGGTLPFVQEAVRKGWIEPIATAGIPVIASGEFPAKFLTGNTAIMGVAPWIVVYNTEKMKSSDVPKDWPDFANPRFKGQILLADPRSSESYLDFWALLADRYGEPFFSRLRAQNLRLYPSGVPTIQALGAGEGSMMLVTTASATLSVKSKGAPIDIVTPDFTTGVEHHIMLTARARAKHPNAARLLANYILSPEGNKRINDSSLSVYQVVGLPRDYKSPPADAPERKGEISKLLGL